MSRPKGTPNRKTQDLAAKAAALGCDPFEILCRIAVGDKIGLKLGEGEKISLDQRQSAAKELSQYLYPKRSAIDIGNQDEEGFKVVIVDYAAKEKKE